MVDLDVLVVGGGPAGSAAALTLRCHTSWRVGMVEATHYGAPRAGECVASAAAPLFAWLGVSDLLVPSDTAMRCHALQGAWGHDEVAARDTILLPQGAGHLVDRRHLDQALALRFHAAGGGLVQGTRLRCVERTACGWRTGVDVEGTHREFQARFVIDATGRRAAFARRVSARVVAADRLVAIVRYAQLPRGDTLPPNVLVESVEHGWWYSAPLPSGRAVVAFFTDADLVARNRLNSPAVFHGHLERARATYARLRACTLEEGITLHPAASQFLDPPLGDDWVAAGDAAWARDPLSSIGIGHALASGIQAARIAHERLRGGDFLARAYAQDLRRHRTDYWAQRAELYGAEARWPSSDFWRRRVCGPAEFTEQGPRARSPRHEPGRADVEVGASHESRGAAQDTGVAGTASLPSR